MVRFTLTRPRRHGYERAHRRRRPVTGRVVAARDAGVMVELPPAVPAFIRRQDLPPSWRRDPSAAIGEQVEGLVTDLRSSRAEVVQLSPRQLGFAVCTAAAEKRRSVRTRVVAANRGGLLAEVHGLPAFVPRSEMRPRDAVSHTALVGTTINAYVIRASTQQAILSAFPPRVRRRRARARA